MEENNNKPNAFLSVIIPLHNGRDYILKALRSIDQQTLKLKLEIIIQDDSSTDDSIEVIKNSEYYNRMNIKIYSSNREIHCPGNTRRDGLSHATGKWVTFIDQDDLFELNAFKDFYNCLITNREQNLVFSNFLEWDPVTDTVLRAYEQHIVFLHGKFYNRSFLEKYNINFKENMLSYEDSYFNHRVYANLAMNNGGYTALNSYTYIWVYNRESISRTQYTAYKIYMEKNYKNYFVATGDAWFELLDKYTSEDQHKQLLYQLSNIVLKGFFYYEVFFVMNKCQDNQEFIDIYKNFINKILDTFGGSINGILDCINSYPLLTDQARGGVITELLIRNHEKFKEPETLDSFLHRIYL